MNLTVLVHFISQWCFDAIRSGGSCSPWGSSHRCLPTNSGDMCVRVACNTHVICACGLDGSFISQWCFWCHKKWWELLTLGEVCLVASGFGASCRGKGEECHCVKGACEYGLQWLANVLDSIDTQLAGCIICYNNLHNYALAMDYHVLIYAWFTVNKNNYYHYSSCSRRCVISRKVSMLCFNRLPSPAAVFENTLSCERFCAWNNWFLLVTKSGRSLSGSLPNSPKLVKFPPCLMYSSLASAPVGNVPCGSGVAPSLLSALLFGEPPPESQKLMARMMHILLAWD